jgi:hypothetical protein
LQLAGAAEAAPAPTTVNGTASSAESRRTTRRFEALIEALSVLKGS